MNTNETPPCSTHPNAPHGFDRDGSHTAGRYVCDCEGWVPPDGAPSDAPTPEVDEAAFGTGRVSVDFARRLERERDEACAQLAAAQAEAARLKEALDNLCIAVAGAGVTPKERELLQECYDKARAALAKEGER